MDLSFEGHSHAVGGVSSSVSNVKCYQCERYERELEKKDETIRELKEKLQAIHNLTLTKSIGESPRPQPQAPSHLQPPKKRKYSITKVNVHNSSPSSTSSSEGCSPTSTNADSKEKQNDQTVKVKLCQPGNSKSRDMSVITVQEIIDKVIERSPKRKASIQILDENNVNLQTLFLRLESEKTSPDDGLLRKRLSGGRDNEFSEVESSSSSNTSLVTSDEESAPKDFSNWKKRSPTNSEEDSSVRVTTSTCRGGMSELSSVRPLKSIIVNNTFKPCRNSRVLICPKCKRCFYFKDPDFYVHVKTCRYGRVEPLIQQASFDQLYRGQSKNRIPNTVLNQIPQGTEISVIYDT